MFRKKINFENLAESLFMIHIISAWKFRQVNRRQNRLWVQRYTLLSINFNEWGKQSGWSGRSP